MTISNEILASYVGKYQNSAESDGQYKLNPGSIFTITKEGGQLRVQAQGQQIINVYPVADDTFFPRISDTDIKFIKADKGAITKLIIHQNGKYIECKKIN